MLHNRFRAVLPFTTLLLGAMPAGNTQGPALVPIRMIAQVGKKPVSMLGDGECKHAPVAAVYGVRSKMWTVRFSGNPDGEIHNLYLTLWRPLAGGSPDQVSLAMRTDGTDYLIDTVKGGPQRGSGTITFRPMAGGGGNFELAGRTRDSTEIRLRVVCPSFVSLNPVGG